MSETACSFAEEVGIEADDDTGEIEVRACNGTAAEERGQAFLLARCGKRGMPAPPHRRVRGKETLDLPSKRRRGDPASENNKAIAPPVEKIAPKRVGRRQEGVPACRLAVLQRGAGAIG